MAEVVLSQLTKTYPERGGSGVTAVSGIDLAVRDREFMVLVGPSGCGKSTTLRMIAGLEEASSGTITIGGRVVNEVPPKDRDIAMVFQNYALYPHMTVYDNMSFGLRLRQAPPEEIERRVREASAMLGLDDYLQRLPKALSGGQRQRVAVGRAIVRKPAVFLFDEPLSNLDAKMRVSTRAEISRLHTRLGATMIYVTHDQVEAMTMGDRICVMNDSRIMQVAAPLELYNRPANLFVAGFIGSPAMNLIHGVIVREHDRAVFVERNAAGGFRLPLDSGCGRDVAGTAKRKVVLGIRPEDVRIVDGSVSQNPSSHIAAIVTVSEPMGSETYLHLTTGAHALIARIPPTYSFSPDQSTQVAFDLAKAHLFDADTQSALRED